MKATRRTFFGFMAAAPVTAKGMAEQAIAKASGIPVLGADGSRDANLAPMTTDGISREPNKTILKWIADHGLPDWRRQDLREEVVRRLQMEPDVMALRSVSMSAKVEMQIERSLSRAIDYETTRRQRNIVRDSWFKKVGFEWWSW